MHTGIKLLVWMRRSARPRGEYKLGKGGSLSPETLVAEQVCRRRH